MVNFTFHAVGGDHLPISVEAHEELLSYLDDHRDIYWVDTFINIMKYVKQQQATSGSGQQPNRGSALTGANP